MSADDSGVFIEPGTAEALAEHRGAMLAWINAAPSERAARWPRVEAAWRRCAALGATYQATQNARAIAFHNQKLRETR
jgi:hypothetical protein